MAKMILDINGKFYEMEAQQAIEILHFGKEKLECGIYGVYKDDYAKALLERYDDKEKLKAAVEKYEWKGFTVLYNE